MANLTLHCWPQLALEQIDHHRLILLQMWLPCLHCILLISFLLYIWLLLLFNTTERNIAGWPQKETASGLIRPVQVLMEAVKQIRYELLTVLLLPVHELNHRYNVWYLHEEPIFQWLYKTWLGISWCVRCRSKWVWPVGRRTYSSHPYMTSGCLHSLPLSEDCLENTHWMVGMSWDIGVQYWWSKYFQGYRDQRDPKKWWVARALQCLGFECCSQGRLGHANG